MVSVSLWMDILSDLVLVVPLSVSENLGIVKNDANFIWLIGEEFCN